MRNGRLFYSSHAPADAGGSGFNRQMLYAGAQTQCLSRLAPLGMKKAGLSPAFLWALCSGGRFRVEFGDVVPVHDLPPGVEVVGALVLVVEVVGVFPHVAAEDGRALDGGGVHQRVVLVRGAGDGEFAVFTDDQPGPAGAELFDAGVFEGGFAGV